MKPRTLPPGLLLLLLFLGCDGTGTEPEKNQVASVTVSPSSSTIEIGNTAQLQAQVRNAKGDLLTTPATWSTSDASVATCSGSGLVTGIGEGTATITASAGGESGTASISVVDLTTPGPPSAISATPLSNSEIQLTWTDNSGNEDEFRIDREQIAGGASGTDGGPARAFAEVGTVGPNVTSFSDTGLQSGSSYRYRVRACNENGCSDPSANQTEVSTNAELAIGTTTLPNGEVDTAYSVFLSATGGDGSYQWAVTSGSLPPGLSLDITTGEISGTPTTGGSYPFTVEAQSGDGQTKTETLTIDVKLRTHCDGPTAGTDCTLSVVEVPDLLGVLCADALGNNICPSSGQTFFGQDGNYSIRPESYTFIAVGDPRLIEAVSGLTWATTAFLADSFSDAETVCGGLASTAYGGATDWRVPSLRELGRIISRGTTGGMWPATMDNPANSVWWTSAPDKADDTRMIGVSGNWPWTYRIPTAGGAGTFQGARYTFCVSGAEMAGAWKVNADDVTVTHTTTGLGWHRSASANQTMDWDTALQYCESSTVGEFTDWRLPTLREYVSVFDLDTPSGYMSEAFGAEPTGKMLTGTPNRIGATRIEIEWVNEDTGILKQENVSTLMGGARCVRGPG